MMTKQDYVEAILKDEPDITDMVEAIIYLRRQHIDVLREIYQIKQLERGEEECL